MNKILFLLLAIIFTSYSYGQSILKRLPKPNNVMLSKAMNSATSATVTAWRLTGPIAGFMYPQNQVVTGLGYGYQKLHWVDSIQKWYTDYSISLVAYAGGNVTPTLSPNNIISLGISAGFLNQLIMVGPAYNLPSGNKKGTVGVVFNVSMPLN